MTKDPLDVKFVHEVSTDLNIKKGTEERTLARSLTNVPFRAVRKASAEAMN